MDARSWEYCEYPEPLLATYVNVKARPSDRKLRLLAVACCRSIGMTFTGYADSFAPVNILDAVENWAETGKKPEKINSSIDLCLADAMEAVTYVSASAWGVAFASDEYKDAYDTYGNEHDKKHQLRQSRKSAVLKDILGNPFDPYVEIPKPSEEIVSLATAAYACRNKDKTLNNDHLGIISDALEESGYKTTQCCPYCPKFRKAKKGEDAVTNVINYSRAKRECVCKGTQLIPNQLIANLRSEGPHYRGMWSLDLLLGKH